MGNLPEIKSILSYLIKMFVSRRSKRALRKKNNLKKTLYSMFQFDTVLWKRIFLLMTIPTEDPFRDGGTHLNMFYLVLFGIAFILVLLYMHS